MIAQIPDRRCAIWLPNVRKRSSLGSVSAPRRGGHVRINRRKLSVAGLGLTLVVAATGCGFGGDSGKSDSSSIDLLVPTYSDNTKGLWQDIIKGFEANNPDIDVNLEVQSWDNINDVVRTKVQANDAPDIL